MRLHEFSNGLYPRRVTIYLVEKGLTTIERVDHNPMNGNWPSAELKALNRAGTVPVLEADDGAVICSSIAILEYLEEKFPTPTMLGPTAEARARVRELVSIADEMTTHFSVWNHKGSALFSGHEPQNQVAGGFAAQAYYKKLNLLEQRAAEKKGEFLAGDKVTIADCVAMAVLQFAEVFHGVPVPSTAPVVGEWYSRFSARPSAVGCVYPQNILDVSRGLLQQCPPLA